MLFQQDFLVQDGRYPRKERGDEREEQPEHLHPPGKAPLGEVSHCAELLLGPLQGEVMLVDQEIEERLAPDTPEGYLRLADYRHVREQGKYCLPGCGAMRFPEDMAEQPLQVIPELAHQLQRVFRANSLDARPV